MNCDAHPDYITTYQSIGGWKAVHVTWSPEFGGFYEPEQTGLGYYAEEADAIEEAKDWALSEGIEYRPREKPSSDSSA